MKIPYLVDCDNRASPYDAFFYIAASQGSVIHQNIVRKGTEREAKPSCDGNT